jgi:hypothetical protein
MTTETGEVSAPETNVQQDEGSLAAGFNKVRGDEPPADSPPVTEPESTAPEASTEVAPANPADAPATASAEPAAPVEEEPMIGGFKESEFKALLAKAQRVDEIEAQLKGNNDKVFGKIGELTRVLKAIQETPAGQPVKVTADSFKRLKEQFPEMAEMLAEDLSGLMPAGNSQAAPDLADLETRFAQRITEETERIQKASAMTLLTMKHSDWKQTVTSDDFKLWTGTLPPDEQRVIKDSWDPVFVSQTIDKFKVWTEEKVKAKTKNNEKRLAANVTPQGAGGPGKTTVPDHAGLSAGFNKVRRSP